jgi:EAL domain-containing protein (putative c-di-GMP-specific phosphodiesterase class I)
MNHNFPNELLETVDGLKIPKKYSCAECRSGAGLEFQFTMTFQPIVDANQKAVYSQEALVRGLNQESAYEILSRVTDQNRYQFDQACRVKAIELASRLNVDTYLNINFLPNAVYQAETCIRTTLEASKTFNFPSNRLIFEITEGEKVTDHDHVISIFKEYKSQGFLTAIDDFGAGYSGLNLLAKFQPDLIKLDMELIRGIDKNRITQVIVRSIMMVCGELKIQVIAEGIETVEEYSALRDLGIVYFQGYLFAKPSFEKLTSVYYPES